MSAVSYHLARLVLSIAAITAFYFLAKWVKVEFSWKLYWCAFAVYVILSLGDAVLKQYWPEMFNHRSRTGTSKMKKTTVELIWFYMSVMYSALCGGAAVNTPVGPLRFFLVFMAIHGALWAILRALLMVLGR